MYVGSKSDMIKKQKQLENQSDVTKDLHEVRILKCSCVSHTGWHKWCTDQQWTLQERGRNHRG